jgi:hypothetical protein
MQSVADRQITRPKAPLVAPDGNRTATFRHAAPCQVSASAPPLPLVNPVMSSPTARQFLGDTHATPNRSSASGVAADAAVRTVAGAADAGPATPAAVPSAVVSATSPASAIVRN